MKAKNMISILAAGIAAMGILTGCGASSANSNTAVQTSAAAQTEGSTTESTTAEESTASTENSAESESNVAADNSTETESIATGAKTLVVYYSATGNTERLAKAAAEAAGADLFEIVPVEAYSSDDLNWTNNNSRVSKEHDDETLRDVELVSTEVENWDSYDTVLFGYPIWWGIAAWPVNEFVKNNDFAGKTVIPFCTSASSGLGQSGELLKEMAGTGDWKEGQRFSSGTSEAELENWVAGLGISLDR